MRELRSLFRRPRRRRNSKPSFPKRHRNSTVSKDPEAYEPGGSFDPDQGTNIRAYNIPFSTGSRACIGRHIAIVELQILISTLVWRVEMRLEREGQELDVFDRFQAKPGALPVRLTRLLE